MRTKNVVLVTLLTFVLGFSLSAQSADDWYLNKPIRHITFDGLKSVDRSEMDGLFGSYLGKPFNDERYWEILQKLYALEYFDDVSPVALPGDPDKTSVLLRFTVKEKPVIRTIVFTGNKQIRASELLEKVSLKEGDIYNELKSRLDERAIRDHYLSKGYSSSRVTADKVQNDDRTITLRFTVEEGKKTVIKALNFEGNRNISSKTLKGTLKLKEERLFSSGVFSEATLEADKIAVRDYYTERGYIDAAIENVIRSVDSESDPENDLLTLTFVVKEGEVWTYGGTTITGNHVFSTEELLSKLRLEEGAVMNLNRFNKGYQALVDVYYENGYTSNYINRSESRDVERKRVSYKIVVAESDRSHIENIIIRGNTKTKDYVIAREFTVEEGDIFSKTKLISSVRNLYNLRYFSSVAPDIVQGSERNLVDVIFNVEEQSTASVQFGLTFSGVTETETFPISAFVQWEDRNFKGLGKTISANVTASTDTQSVTLATPRTGSLVPLSPLPLTSPSGTRTFMPIRIRSIPYSATITTTNTGWFPIPLPRTRSTKTPPLSIPLPHEVRAMEVRVKHVDGLSVAAQTRDRHAEGRYRVFRHAELLRRADLPAGGQGRARQARPVELGEQYLVQAFLRPPRPQLRRVDGLVRESAGYRQRNPPVHRNRVLP
jgi:outer membrane protein insertion porin family